MFLRTAMLEYSENYTVKNDRKLLLPYAYIILAVNLIISAFAFSRLHVFDTASNISNCFSTIVGLVLFVLYFKKSNSFLRTIMIGSTVLFVFGYINILFDIQHKHTDIFYETGLLLELLILTFALGKQHIKEQNEAMQSKQQLEQELGLKNRALVFKAAQLSAKEEAFESIKDKFRLAMKNNQKSFEGILLEGITDKYLWKDFEVHFGETHPGFYKNLMEKFPSLTQNEIRLCSFLKLNLNTKEISIITRKSVHSIEAMRSRIRHKMGLERDANISYILSHFEPLQIKQKGN
jgi:DNA-binding CsgD family transcriptional regulator